MRKKAVLTAAVMSGFRHPYGLVDASAMEAALAMGFTKEAIYVAVRSAKQKRRKNIMLHNTA